MKHALLLVTLLGWASSALAGEDEERSLDRGLDLLQEGTQLLLRGLMDEMQPALDDLRGALSNLDVYYPPEVLPNGDIIIRRKVPLTPEDPEPGETEI